MKRTLQCWNEVSSHTHTPPKAHRYPEPTKPPSATQSLAAPRQPQHRQLHAKSWRTEPVSQNPASREKAWRENAAPLGVRNAGRPQWSPSTTCVCCGAQASHRMDSPMCSPCPSGGWPGLAYIRRRRPKSCPETCSHRRRSSHTNFLLARNTTPRRRHVPPTPPEPEAPSTKTEEGKIRR